MGKRLVGDCRPFFVGASDSIKGNALRAVAEALRTESVLLRYGDAPDQLLGQHTRRQPPERFFIGAASRRFAGCFIASRLGPQRHKAWPLAREYPLRMHIFYAHQNDQPAGGHFPAPDGSGNRRLRDAKKVGQIGSRASTRDSPIGSSYPFETSEVLPPLSLLPRA